jgi:hypothetical protein
MLRIQKPMSDGLRLGELLIGAGILTREAVEAALTLAFASRLPARSRIGFDRAVARSAGGPLRCCATTCSVRWSWRVLDARRVIQELTWGAEHIVVGHA